MLPWLPGLKTPNTSLFDTTADTVAGFVDFDLVARLVQLDTCCEPGEPCSDDRNVHQPVL